MRYSPQKLSHVLDRRVTGATSRTRLPRSIRWFLLQSALWTALCIAVECISGFLLHLPEPWTSPVLSPASRLYWVDFIPYIPKFAFIHSATFFGGQDLTYPAPAAALMKLFLLPQPHGAQQVIAASLRMSGFVFFGAIVMAVLWRRALLRAGLASRTAGNLVAATFLLAFPFWFLLYVGNIEFAVWFVLAAAFYCFLKGHESAAAVLFGVAAALKIFPVILLGLFLARRRFAPIVIACATALVVTVISLWILCPDIATSWRLTSQAIAHMRPFYMLTLRPMETGFDHTLFVLLKRLLPTLPPPARMETFLNIYLGAAAIGGVALFFLRICRLPLINQVLCLTIAMVFLPPVSYEYTLVHLYVPFALRVFYALADRARDTPALLAIFSLFAFVLSMQSEFIHAGLRYAGQLKAVALLAMMLLALLHRFPSEFDERAAMRAAS